MKENGKEIEYVLHCSNAPERNYIYSGEVKESYTQQYDYYPEAVQLKRVAAGDMGNISDAYILYILSLSSHASAETVINFLTAYVQAHKELHIIHDIYSSSQQSEPMMLSRMKFMANSGFLFRKSYDVDRPDGKYDRIVLYGTNKETQTYMNMKLRKRVVIRTWNFATPIDTAIAEAATSYVASVVALKSGCRLEALKEDAIKTAEMGTIIPSSPCLFLDSTDEKYQVMFCPAFLNQDTSYQTDNDFERTLKYKVDLIRNYLYAYNRGGNAPVKRPAYCTVVCESKKDMENMKLVIQQTRSLIKTGNLPNVYFTSEGAIRTITNIKDAFLRLDCTEEGELYFKKEIPPFIKSR